jgi:hypothetical protein
MAADAGVDAKADAAVLGTSPPASKLANKSGKAAADIAVTVAGVVSKGVSEDDAVAVAVAVSKVEGEGAAVAVAVAEDCTPSLACGSSAIAERVILPVIRSSKCDS